MRSDLSKICHDIEHSAVKVGTTIVFVALVGIVVLHELHVLFIWLIGH